MIKHIELFCEGCEGYVLHNWHTDKNEAKCLMCNRLNPVDREYELKKIEEEKEKWPTL